MRSLVALFCLLVLLCAQTSSALRCFECHFVETTGEGENWCKDNGDSIDTTKAVECDTGFDVCVFVYNIDADDSESYWRYCGTSTGHNDETDKCISYDKWGQEHKECVCDEDECNSATQNSISLITFAFLAAIMALVS